MLIKFNQSMIRYIVIVYIDSNLWSIAFQWKRNNVIKSYVNVVVALKGSVSQYLCTHKFFDTY